MDAAYFRALSVRCNRAALNCYDLRAAEELRHLADEFARRAKELERKSPLSFLKKPWGRDWGRDTEDEQV